MVLERGLDVVAIEDWLVGFAGVSVEIGSQTNWSRGYLSFLLGFINLLHVVNFGSL